MLEIMWLGALLAGLFLWVRHDARQYRLFKTVDDTRIRQLFYWRWTVQSFVILTGASVVTLWMLGRFDAVAGLPAELQPLADLIGTPGDADAPSDWSGERMLGFAIGAGMGIALVAFIHWRRMRKALTPVIGDIEPLMPRNGHERLIMIPLSLNAGFSEELFFRLALPLLVAHVTGSAIVAAVVATAAFGLAHAYQGWKGVLGTALIGGVLMSQYLVSGSLLRVMIIHAAIDLVALIVRPAIADRLGARRLSPAAGTA